MPSSRQRLTGTSISKHQRVSSTSNISSLCTANTSDIATMSKSASMRSAGSFHQIVSHHHWKAVSNTTRRTRKQEAKPNHVWLEQHTLTGISTSNITIRLIWWLPKRSFPRSNLWIGTLNWCSVMKRIQFVNLWLRVATCTRISHRIVTILV